jgi:hypothetical protein
MGESWVAENLSDISIVNSLFQVKRFDWLIWAVSPNGHGGIVNFVFGLYNRPLGKVGCSGDFSRFLPRNTRLKSLLQNVL